MYDLLDKDKEKNTPLAIAKLFALKYDRFIKYNKQKWYVLVDGSWVQDDSVYDIIKYKLKTEIRKDIIKRAEY